jgi:hypothetical protein
VRGIIESPEDRKGRRDIFKHIQLQVYVLIFFFIHAFVAISVLSAACVGPKAQPVLLKS